MKFRFFKTSFEVLLYGFSGKRRKNIFLFLLFFKRTVNEDSFVVVGFCVGCAMGASGTMFGRRYYYESDE